MRNLGKAVGSHSEFPEANCFLELAMVIDHDVLECGIIGPVVVRSESILDTPR